MANFKQLYMDYIKREGIHAEDVKKNVVKVTYKGNHLPQIPIFLYFEENGDPFVAVKCWEIINFGGHAELGITVCNKQNEKYRWVKFYIDHDDDVIAELDAYVDEQNCGFVCSALVHRMVSVVDGAYPEFVNALWG